MSELLPSLIDRLNTQKRLRLWSLVVTIFGDAILPRSNTVSARTISDIIEHMGIEPGALRTAFSRLAKDGWITRIKQGRNAHYQLAPDAALSFAEAARKIYFAAPQMPHAQTDISIAILPPDAEPDDKTLKTNGAIFAAPRTIILNSLDASTQDRLPFNKVLSMACKYAALPDWLHARIITPQDHADMQALMANFSPLVTKSQFDPATALALRSLLIHEWRRISLRLPAFALLMAPTGSPEYACRTFVKELYQQLLPASEAWLDANATGPDGTLPAGSLDSRFSQSV